MILTILSCGNVSAAINIKAVQINHINQQLDDWDVMVLNLVHLECFR